MSDHDQSSWRESVNRHADLLRDAISSNAMRLHPDAVVNALRNVDKALEDVGCGVEKIHCVGSHTNAVDSSARASRSTSGSSAVGGA